MSSSNKRRQTMAKMTRERAVKEKRALKQEKRDERKAAAAAARDGTRVDESFPAETADDETRDA